MSGSAGKAHVFYVTVDRRDPQRLAEFWSGPLGVEVAGGFGETYVLLKRPSEEAIAMAFQRVSEDKVVKNRAHVDVQVEDLEAATAWVEGNGGSRAEDHEEEGYRWRVMRDPEDNEFCFMPASQG
jgi:predicted enzyme related to lactoylglutathione lyase